MTRAVATFALALLSCGCGIQSTKPTPDTPQKRLEAKGATVGHAKQDDGRHEYTVIMTARATPDIWQDVAQLEHIHQLTLTVQDLDDTTLKSMMRVRFAPKTRLELSGNGQCSVTDWTSLRELGKAMELDMYLRRLPLPPEAVTEIAGLPGLTSLGIAECDISDAAIPSLLSAKKFTSLHLTDNSKISDDGLMQLAALETLTYVNVEFTSVTPAGVSRFKQKRPDCDIRVSWE